MQREHGSLFLAMDLSLMCFAEGSGVHIFCGKGVHIMRKHTRRGILGLALATTTMPVAATASGFKAGIWEDVDPADLVPRRFSVRRIVSRSQADLYKVTLALKRGRPITIEGYTPSESREIIMLLYRDRPAGLARLGVKGS